MKIKIIALAASTFLISAILNSCNAPTEKIDFVQNNYIESNKDLGINKDEYLVDVAIYRIETADKIAAYEKNLVDLKARIAMEKNDNKTEYDNKIAELENKDTDMKMKMINYKIDGKENWEIFNKQFKYDMDELNKAFKNLASKNAEYSEN